MLGQFRRPPSEKRLIAGFMEVRKSQKCDVWEWTSEGRRSITQRQRRPRGRGPATKGRAPGRRKAVCRQAETQRPHGTAHDSIEKGIQLSDTIHLHDLTPAERLVEEA